MAEFSGHLSLHAATRAHGRTVLAAQSFRAPYHLSKPYWDADTRTLIAQVVNPTAGILSGDQLQSDISVDQGAALLVTTPSASRVFKMKTGTATCRQQFHVTADAWLEVMPEPLVPHRGCSYRQTTTIEVAAGDSVALTVPPSTRPGTSVGLRITSMTPIVVERLVTYPTENELAMGLAVPFRTPQSGPVPLPGR